MKILFYGGCHGAALRRIIERYSRNVERVEHLTNFVIIREGKPFPYDQLSNFDYIIFNPILNKKEYNTSHIENYCRENGIKYLKYPWIQWEGYYPTVKKAAPSWYSGWWLSGLDAIADQSASFDEFAGRVFDGDALHGEALDHIVRTSEFLRRLESGTDIKILNYIIENFREKRLFLTPDHGTTELYKYIIKEISKNIGIDIDPSFYHTNQEVQSGILIPVLPSISRALGLTFAGGDFQNHLVMGEKIYSLTEFLKLHYFRRDIRYVSATRNTRIRGPETGVAYSIKQGTRLLSIAPDAERDGKYHRLELLGITRGDVRRRFPIPVGKPLNYFRPHWSVSDQVSIVADTEERDALTPAQQKPPGACDESSVSCS